MKDQHDVTCYFISLIMCPLQAAILQDGTGGNKPNLQLGLSASLHIAKWPPPRQI